MAGMSIDRFFAILFLIGAAGGFGLAIQARRAGDNGRFRLGLVVGFLMMLIGLFFAVF
jgi:formate-dependent nitrite reductase membrane component NrfD